MKFYVVKCNNDRRYDFVEKLLAEDGHEITEKPEDCEALVLPMFVTQDGVHVSGTDLVLEELLKKIPENALVFGGVSPCPVLNYLKEDYFQIKNAIPTSEGAVAVAMTYSPKTIRDSRVLVLGGGHEAQYLSSLLIRMGADVTLGARNDAQRTYAEVHGCKSVKLSELSAVLGDQDIIFNTIPAEIFDEEMMKAVKKDSLFIEIAVSHPCMNVEKAKEMGINYRIEPRLPGRYSPEAGARVVVDTIYRLMPQ